MPTNESPPTPTTSTHPTTPLTPPTTTKPRGCERFEPWMSVWEHCTSSSKVVLEHHHMFKNNPLGSKPTMDFDPWFIEELCAEYNRCPRLAEWKCALPKLVDEKNYVCMRAEILRSYVGSCMRQIKKTSPLSIDVDSFFNDFSEKGMAQKCAYMSGQGWKSLLNGLLLECGENAKRDMIFYHFHINDDYNC